MKFIKNAEENGVVGSGLTEYTNKEKNEKIKNLEEITCLWIVLDVWIQTGQLLAYSSKIVSNPMSQILFS